MIRRSAPIEAPSVSSVTVSIVLHDSAADIAGCLRAVGAQTRMPDEIVVLDNASTDAGLAAAVKALAGIRTILSERNLGFAGGQNRAMNEAPADVHIVLNPDCRLAPDFIHHVLLTVESDRMLGAISGRLLRFRADTEEPPMAELPDDLLDSTGMVALRNRRVLDRGTDERAAGRYVTADYVFGASGAAAVYRRAMLDDVAFEDQYFDESFFAYREDVDLAWRAQHLGWRTRYVPEALARHRRRVAPGRRRQLPASINRRSIANRWRMIAKNETAMGFRADWGPMALRDVLTIGYCAVREPGSLLAVRDVWRSRSVLADWRRDLMRRRRVDEADVLAWFGRRAALPLEEAQVD
jgi:GT2 family glycosyltransferase